MKLPRSILPAGLVLAAMFSSGPGCPAVRGADEIVLINFADSRRDPDGKIFHAYEYAYDAWGKRNVTDLRGRGVLVKAPSGKGGMGENRTMVRFDRAAVAELVFVLGTGNKAAAVNFALTDRDGTEHQWSIPLVERPPGQLQRQRIDFTQPGSEQKAGKTPGLDRKKMSTWQIRGDYSDAPIELLLVKLVAAGP